MNDLIWIAGKWNVKIANFHQSKIRQSKYNLNTAKKTFSKCIHKNSQTTYFTSLVNEVGKHAPVITRLFFVEMSHARTFVCSFNYVSSIIIVRRTFLFRELFLLLSARDYNFMACGKSRMEKAIFRLK